MNYQPIVLPHFKKQLKPLCKKHRHFKNEVIAELKKFNPANHQPLGHNVYKIRIASKDISRGKGRSFRLVVFVIERKQYILPIAVYYKRDKQNMSLREINDHLEIILLEADM